MIKAADNTGINQEFPDFVSKKLTFSPEIVLDLLPYYIAITENNRKEEDTCLSLILRCLDQLRYNLDRKSQKAIELFNSIQHCLSLIFSQGTPNKLSKLNAVIYESKLPFTLKIDDETLLKNSNKGPDIMPRLPEFLEMVRRENRIRSSFDLHDGFMSQLQIMPTDFHLSMVIELAVTKKSTPHEIAVMMLLNTKAEIRQQIAHILIGCVDQKTFTSLDLRRLIVIRNWVPSAERMPIDNLIKAIRLQGISPTPYPIGRIDNMMASTFDGAGAQLISFSARQGSARVIGGFILKHDVGIREPWVNLKAVKGEYESMLENSKLISKSVTIAYVNKAVKHFLAEGHEHGYIPTPFFLQIAEILGATEWQPELINIRAELNRLHNKVDMELKTPNGIKTSLKRSGDWYHSESFFKYWFECGEAAEKLLIEAVESHKNMTGKDAKSLEEVVTQKVIKPAIKKWKTIILFMCLWARSNLVKDPLWMDLFILAEQLELEAIELTDIPAMKNIAGQSAASIFMHANV